MLDVVMEVSKLTEKRFTIADYPTDIQDNQTGKKYRCSSYGTHMEIICDLLNGLNDELGKYRILYASKEKTSEVLLRDGIALEHEIKSLKTENQKLKQFQNKVFDLIDTKIKEETYSAEMIKKTLSINEDYVEPVNILTIKALEQLKKELQND